MIDIYCVGMSQGEDLTLLGGCGIVLVYTDDYKRIQQREFHFGLGGSNIDLCEIQAVRLGLAATTPAIRGVKTTLHIRSTFVADGLTKTLDVHCSDAMKEARRWYSYYKNIHVVVHSEPNGLLQKAAQLANIGMTTQREFDSQTVRISDDSAAKIRK